MKEVRCINARSYNLTVGRVYNTRQENDDADMHLIINDRGLERSYNSELFEDVNVASTAEQIIQSINVTVRQNNGNLIVRASVEVDGEMVNTNDIQLTGLEARNSCGITEFSGINTLIDSVDAAFSEDRVEDLKYIILQRIFNTIKNGTTFDNCGMITFSTNDDCDLYDTFNDVITNIANSTTRTVNPNHDSNISLWVLTVNGN